MPWQNEKGASKKEWKDKAAKKKKIRRRHTKKKQRSRRAKPVRTPSTFTTSANRKDITIEKTHRLQVYSCITNVRQSKRNIPWRTAMKAPTQIHPAFSTTTEHRRRGECARILVGALEIASKLHTRT